MHESLDEPVGGHPCRLAHAEDRDDDVFREELQHDVVPRPHQLGDPMSRGSRPPDVDREPQGVPGRDAGAAGESLVEDVEARDLADALARSGQGLESLSEELLSPGGSESPCGID